MADPGDLRVNLALQGGGVLGIAEVGVVAALRQAGYRIANVAGTSAGSIVAALLASGMDDAALRRATEKLDYLGLVQPPAGAGRVRSFLRRVPVVGRLVNVALTGGIASGDRLTEFIDGQLRSMGAATWGELRARVAAGRGSNLRVITYAYNTRGRVTFPDDVAATFGHPADDERVAAAVRASSAITGLFPPVAMRDANGRTWLLGDGGPAEDYPWLSAQRMDPSLPTVGVRLAGPSEFVAIARHGPRSVLRLIERRLTTNSPDAAEALDALPGVVENTIRPQTFGIRATDFGISRADVERLYASGLAAGRAWAQRDLARRGLAPGGQMGIAAAE
jgi:NTE family protein